MALMGRSGQREQEITEPGGESPNERKPWEQNSSMPYGEKLRGKSSEGT